ncbi:MAG TPA: Smr/MutS family protein [Spirochaetia bacterium]|nr:Smr/MutS family protein [Spirochaetia bacterium]
MSFDEWIDRYPPDQDAVSKDAGSVEPPERRRVSEIQRMRHEAELDLHGLTVDDALKRVDLFLLEARRLSLRKVLVIHGKGLHSDRGEAVLARAVRTHLENHPLAGRLLSPPPRFGGNGALWVLLRLKDETIVPDI